MVARSVSRFLALLVLAAVSTSLVPSTGRTQTFQYPPYGAVRGRMVSRDGLFHSTRYRWGNGLTTQGAAFLTDAVQTIVPIIPSLVGAATGRDFDANGEARDARDLSRREPARFTAPSDYVIAQQEANALLQRTANLLGGASPPPTSTPVANPNTKLSEELTKHPGDPWKDNKEQ